MCPARQCATTWQCWRPRATSHNRTPAPDGFPTDKGYRLFVDRISEVKPLSPAERRAILSVLDSGVDLDDVLRRSVKLFAQLTRQVAIIQYPVLSSATVRHLEVVSLSPSRLLLVVITDNGRVEQRMVTLSADIDERDSARLRDMFSVALHGQRLEAAAAVAELANQAPDDIRHHVVRVATVLVETLVERGDDRLILGGVQPGAVRLGLHPLLGGMDSVLEAPRSRSSCSSCSPTRSRWAGHRADR